MSFEYYRVPNGPDAQIAFSSFQPYQDEIIEKSYTKNGVEAIVIVCEDHRAARIYSRHLRKKEIKHGIDIDSVVKKKHFRAKATRKKPYKQEITAKNGEKYSIVVRRAGETALNFVSN